MKFSYQWIAELVSGLDIEPAALERLITMKTAECEGIELVGTHFEQVVAVRVVKAEPLGAGRNRRVEIEAKGGARHQVVCGAPNVRLGMLAVWMPPGTSLNGKRIGIATIDGVESEGMLASASELQIGRDHSGLLELADLQPGEPLAGLRPDWIIEIDNKSLTHRPDLWGHHGMAREIAAIANRPLLDPIESVASNGEHSPWKVEIEDFARCSRYSLQTYENVKIAPSSPAIAARLESVGLNSINNIVDITNYVLAELPQPMHAFDADKLTGHTIFVRRALPAERLAALNGETYDLHAEDLVIADGSGAIALAGVIGDAPTAISESTKRIVLESANFDAASVRLTSVRHKLRTDASARFEKALDPENTVRGLRRAAILMQQICPSARPQGGIVDLRGTPPEPISISLPEDYVARKLGKAVSSEQIAAILTALGFKVHTEAGGGLTINVPSWRATKDISNKADLVEEVGRMIGYGEINPAAPKAAVVVPASDPMRTFLRDIRSNFAHQGFTEISSYSFVSPAEAQRFAVRDSEMLAVANPIAAELSHMRTSLLPSLFRSVAANVRHLREFRLFEIGREIHARSPGQLPDEIPHIAAAIYSAHADEQEFFEMKRVVECFLRSARVEATAARKYEHPARTAAIVADNLEVGRLFELHPGLFEAEGIEGRAVLLDLDLRLALKVRAQNPFHYQSPRRYPTSGFDLSVVTTLKVPVAEIHDGLLEFAGNDLALIEFVRQYDGPPLAQGQKSVTYRLEVGALDHTVTADEVTAIRNRITEGMRTRGFEFRG